MLSCYGFDLLFLMAHSVDHLFIFLDRCLIRSFAYLQLGFLFKSLKVLYISKCQLP